MWKSGCKQIEYFKAFIGKVKQYNELYLMIFCVCTFVVSIFEII